MRTLQRSGAQVRTGSCSHAQGSTELAFPSSSPHPKDVRARSRTHAHRPRRASHSERGGFTDREGKGGGRSQGSTYTREGRRDRVLRAGGRRDTRAGRGARHSSQARREAERSTLGVCVPAYLHAQRRHRKQVDVPLPLSSLPFLHFSCLCRFIHQCSFFFCMCFRRVYIAGGEREGEREKGGLILISPGPHSTEHHPRGCCGQRWWRQRAIAVPPTFEEVHRHCASTSAARDVSFCCCLHLLPRTLFFLFFPLSSLSLSPLLLSCSASTDTHARTHVGQRFAYRPSSSCSFHSFVVRWCVVFSRTPPAPLSSFIFCSLPPHSTFSWSFRASVPCLFP